MRKYIKGLLVCVIIMFVGLFTFQMVSADSGFDGSYDSGSSSSSSSSSSISSSDYSSSSNYSGTGIKIDISPSGVLFILFGIIIVNFYLLRAYINRDNNNILTKQKFDKQIDEFAIRSVLLDFNMEEFKESVFEIYKKIQVAWMDFDYDTLRKYTTDELYNLYHSQLLTLNIKGQKNIMKDFEMLSFRVYEMEHNDDVISLKVFVTVECYDYIVNKDNKCIRGNNEKKVRYEYAMTFVRSIKNDTNICPNCGAKLDNNNSTVCPYCRSTIINNNFGWSLSKKQVISQTTNVKK